MREMVTETKKTRGVAATAAGTSDVNCALIATAGFEAINADVCFGAIVAGAVTGCHWQGGNKSDGTDQADLAGTELSITDAQDGLMLTTDLIKPVWEYVRLVVDRATQNATLDSVVYTQYRSPKKVPTTHDATTVAGKKVSISPAAGTP